jgi:creatinine amidohydrolase
MLIEEITSREFSAGLEKTRTVLLPVGATEEHGPHLPIGTDTFQAWDVCVRLAARRPVFVAPAIAYGVCRSTADHPGTIGISTETLKALVGDVVRALYRQGLRNVVILSGHAGGTHNAALLDAGEALLESLPELRIAVATEYELAKGEGGGIIETEGDSHAGEIETSRMLATRPQLVKGEAPAAYPCFPRHILVRDKQAFWPSGVWGDPTRASAAKGRQIEDVVVMALERLVADLERFDEQAGPGPDGRDEP